MAKTAGEIIRERAQETKVRIIAATEAFAKRREELLNSPMSDETAEKIRQSIQSLEGQERLKAYIEKYVRERDARKTGI